MLDSIRVGLSNHPLAGVGTSIGGYILSLSEFISPLFRFLILTLNSSGILSSDTRFSTITAISVAYVQYNKARRIWNVKNENTSKKGNNNSR